ncbi:hypothetical protein TNCV_4961581 [Trichonephila clavipes]|uniref:Uncharacterized protein n=1 Tax=Trichonephila clavipes TaxID=2585209 RepID=A0A8X6VIA9_TRICX|nr:hypothetical protein TNCV_4961581 [Trichonephila clavipes]
MLTFNRRLNKKDLQLGLMVKMKEQNYAVFIMTTTLSVIPISIELKIQKCVKSIISPDLNPIEPEWNAFGEKTNGTITSTIEHPRTETDADRGMGTLTSTVRQSGTECGKTEKYMTLRELQLEVKEKIEEGQLKVIRRESKNNAGVMLTKSITAGLVEC